MSRTLSQFFRDEYARLRTLAVDTWHVDSGYLGSVDDLLKPIHKRYLSLACAATVAGHRATRNEYAEGVVEVGHLALILALKGLDNPSCVLLRQSIELVLKHIFFLSHPVEYAWAQSRPDYKDLTYQSLVQYVERTDEYRALRDSGRVLAHISNSYAVLSRFVHVHSGGFMRYSGSGLGYRGRRVHVRKLNERTKALWPSLIVLLVIYQLDRFRNASLIEQRLVKHALGSQHKALFY